MTPRFLCRQGLIVVYDGFTPDSLDPGHPRLSFD